ncbi:MAG TPA: hypothetical protein ENG87_02850 [Candidatus Pacearchaeota archaeon]|nr:hypothetical protein [Candidatus Pacearchaeota archaeon]
MAKKTAIDYVRDVRNALDVFQSAVEQPDDMGNTINAVDALMNLVQGRNEMAKKTAINDEVKIMGTRSYMKKCYDVNLLKGILEDAVSSYVADVRDALDVFQNTVEQTYD